MCRDVSRVPCVDGPSDRSQSKVSRAVHMNRIPEQQFPAFSGMLSRRVRVLRLGSRGPGADQKSLRLCVQASAKRWRVLRVFDS